MPSPTILKYQQILTSFLCRIHTLSFSRLREWEVIMICKEAEYMVCVLREQEKGGSGRPKKQIWLFDLIFDMNPVQ